ncbi:hypothetical protein TNCV_996211 [Trichonephila clavipes]|nr:hypothetical protein TNCV_996211 [Trichonephila clavipes]
MALRDHMQAGCVSSLPTCFDPGRVQPPKTWPTKWIHLRNRSLVLTAAPTAPTSPIREVKKNYGKAHNSTEISQFVVIIDKIIEQLDSYDFPSSTAKNEFANDAYLFQDLVKQNFATVRRNEILTDLECHDELVKKLGIRHHSRNRIVHPGYGKKQKNKFDSPTKETSSAKKIKTSCGNQFEALGVDLPDDDIGDISIDEEDARNETSTPIPRVRPPPPITIDNVSQPAQLLRKSKSSLNRSSLEELREKA